MGAPSSALLHCLVIRADASANVGGGHIMRCMALARAWDSANDNATTQSSRVVFVCAEITDDLYTQIVDQGFECRSIEAERGSLEDAELTLSVSEELDAAAVVLDGYCFTRGYQQSLYGRVRKLVLYDDEAIAESFKCHILVNQNVSADAKYYQSRAGRAELLMGAKYASIRREFTQYASYDRKYSGSSRILVSLGLSDTTETIFVILRALELITDTSLQISILVGGSDIVRLQKMSQSMRHSVECLPQVNNVAERLIDADFAILASGGTANEAATLATPMILVCVADNQEPAYQEYVRFGGALAGGLAPHILDTEFAEVSRRMIDEEGIRQTCGHLARKAVDGCGATRVVEAILSD